MGDPGEIQGITTALKATAALAGILVAVSAAHAAPLAHPFDLTTMTGADGVKITISPIPTCGADSPCPNPASFGSWVTSGGDFNDDGLSDVFVSAPHRLHLLNPYEGVLGMGFLLYGRSGAFPTSLDAAELTVSTGRVFLPRPLSEGLSGFASRAGDFNGDERGDLLVSELASYAGGGSRAYVVFGDDAPTTVGLDMAGLSATQGFSIPRSLSTSTGLWYAARGIGDLNADGFDDIALFSGGVDYVLFGSPDPFPSVVDPTLVDGTNGFAVENSLGYVWDAVGGGDFNGDGFDDLMISSPEGSSAEWIGGRAIIVLGTDQPFPPEIDIQDAPTTGTIVLQAFLGVGIPMSGGFSRSLSFLGDTNGDGFSDVGFSPSYGGGSYPESLQHAGMNVFRGRRGLEGAVIDMNSLDGRTGFSVVPAFLDYDTVEGIVSAAGDVNGDGYSDILWSAMDSDGAPYYEETHVIYGSSSDQPSTRSLATADGVWATRIDPGAVYFVNAAGLGDVNGDGASDMGFGIPMFHVSDPDYQGEAFIVFGSDDSSTATYRSFVRAGDARKKPIGDSPDGSAASRVWIDFADGSGPNNRNSSLVHASIHRSRAGIGGFNHPLQVPDVYWHVASDRGAWTTAAITVQYTDGELGGIAEANLRLYRAADPAGPWTEVPSSVADTQRNRVTATTSALGYFALSAMAPDAGVEAWRAME